MRSAFFISCLLAVALLISCKKDKSTDPADKLEGGKGGSYDIAVFSVYQNKGKAARAYLKYAADKAPADSSQYDEKQNTMTEPGFGPHVHFTSLRTGTYYIALRSGDTLSTDTVIVIRSTDPDEQDITMHFK